MFQKIAKISRTEKFVFSKKEIEYDFDDRWQKNVIFFILFPAPNPMKLFFRYPRIFPFFIVKLGLFIINEFFLYLFYKHESLAAKIGDRTKISFF